MTSSSASPTLSRQDSLESFMMRPAAISQRHHNNPAGGSRFWDDSDGSDTDSINPTPNPPPRRTASHSSRSARSTRRRFRWSQLFRRRPRTPKRSELATGEAKPSLSKIASRWHR
ncbi:hypothetical protein CONPUDRAFT_137535 [Coniophora puteana RWD-64-598 SS2]|uniref:Uncharacterized protein n=1 Tax=Coniophora puteana (strain RWD-64-598) TaxID=741705 RepID=A0A5M3MLW8_CONPW|nr:uncharacterized protein CONPUDRAFT_137535 [Coniophora puteana RWD-64-598 SS2]EIW80232.1 hypothetical protein CONPUDRAFT_137535 [Coniophora puteana RWD-64-598 SS2]